MIVTQKLTIELVGEEVHTLRAMARYAELYVGIIAKDNRAGVLELPMITAVLGLAAEIEARTDRGSNERKAI